MWRRNNQNEELQLFETHILSVHINCDGCKHKVKKLLKKIEGVYSVNVDVENQAVIVSGSVDVDVLIKKLAKSGKHAEIWSPNPKRKPKQVQASANPKSFAANQHNVTENMFSGYKSSELEDNRDIENFLNQQNAIKEARGMLIPQDFVENSRMENVFMNAEHFDGIGRMGNNVASIMGNADYRGQYIPSYQQNHLPYMLMANKQQQQFQNLTPAEIGNFYVQDRYTRNNLMNEIYRA